MSTLARTKARAMGDPAEGPLTGPLTDLDLVRRTRGGDPEAYSELVRRHERMVYNLAFRFMRNAQAAEDMALGIVGRNLRSQLMAQPSTS